MVSAALTSKDWTTVCFDEGRSTLRSWREENVRRSEEVVELWEHVVSRHPNSLGDELWLVYEQVLIGALDCARPDVAEECLQALKKKFRNSMRVNKLHGMYLEAHHRFEEALTIYDSLVEQDSTNSGFRKRRVAVYLAQGKRPEAIKELNDYLKIFLNDTEAWMQLCDLYLCDMDYSKACHCMHELIITQPHNHLYHQKLADIKYTQGGTDNMETAKQYYLQSAKLNPQNLRSLNGLLLCCGNLQAKQSGNKKKDLCNLMSWAAHLINDKYCNSAAEPGKCNPNEHIILGTVDQIVQSNQH